MTRIDDTFSMRLARLLSLAPGEGRTFTFNLPQGEITVTISPELTEAERRHYNIMTATRSVHVEGNYRIRGISHSFSYNDTDGDGRIGGSDDGGLFDSAQYFVCGETENPADSFYQQLVPLIEYFVS